MVFKSFAKHTVSTPKPAFFESSYPYLKNYNNLINLNDLLNQSSNWNSSNPHPSAAFGNHLVYDYNLQHLTYSILNDDNNNPKNQQPNNLQALDVSQLLKSSKNLKSKKLIHLNNELSYSASVKKPLIYSSNKYYSSLALNRKQEVKEEDEIKILDLEEQARELKQQLDIQQQSREPQPFEVTFLENSLEQLNQCVTRRDFNRVLSIYHSLKRNEIQLDSTVFNLILKSIDLRTTDETTEEKLTHLLTVYSDMLANKIVPTNETYSIVLEGLLKGALKSFFDNEPNSKDFAKIAIDLFSSIKTPNYFEPAIYENLLIVYNIFPYLTTSNDFSHFFSFINKTSFYGSALYFLGFINYSKFLKDEALAIELYETYKSLAENNQELKSVQYEIYSKVIESLIVNGNLSLATKFLDEIIIQIREQSGLASPLVKLTSAYINGLIDSNQIDKAYDYFMKFNQVQYLPDLSIEVTSKLCSRFIQAQNLEVAIKIYDYMSTRQDYFIQRGDTLKLPTSLGQKIDSIAKERHIDARSLILDLSIQKGEKNYVFRLIKEVLLKKKALDVVVLNSLISYLGQLGQHDLVVNLIEQQSTLSKNNLNSFLSSIADSLNFNTVRLLIESPLLVKAASTFRISKDNVYGILKVSEVLFQLFEAGEISKANYQRVMKVYSELILEFHDIDNYYLDLPDQIMLFRETLAYNMQLIAQAYSSFGLDSNIEKNIVQALKVINVNASYFEGSAGDDYINNWSREYDINLSYILRLNYNKGLENFKKLYGLGYKFNFETWQIVLSKEMKKTNEFLDSELFDRITLIDNKEDLLKLFSQLLKENELKSTFVENMLDYVIVSNLKMSDELFDSFSANIGNNELFDKLTSSFFKINKNPEDLANFPNFASKLKEYRRYEDVIALNQQTNVELTLLLKSYLKVGDYEAFAEAYKTVETTEVSHLNLLIEYCILSRQFDKIDSLDFSSFNVVKDNKTKQLLSFNKFLKAFENSQSVTDSSIPRVSSLLEFSNELLVQSSLRGMANVFESNKDILQNKFGKTKTTELVNQLFTNVLTINLFTENVKQEQLISKLNQTVKFCQYLKVSEVHSDNLMNILKVLAISGNSTRLNAIFNQFVSPAASSDTPTVTEGVLNSKFSSRLDYYMLRSFYGEDEKFKIFKVFYACFKYLNETHNTEVINELFDLELPESFSLEGLVNFES